SYAVRLVKWRDLSPAAAPSRSALLDTIAAATRDLPRGSWFSGYRFNERNSGGYPDLAELDAASYGRPLFILRTDGHLGLANSAAFAACGIAADAIDPLFGRFDRGPDGAFTGLVRETAAHLFLARIHEDDTDADIATGMEKVFDEALSLGITSMYNSLTSSRAI